MCAWSPCALSCREPLAREPLAAVPEIPGVQMPAYFLSNAAPKCSQRSRALRAHDALHPGGGPVVLEGPGHL